MPKMHRRGLRGLRCWVVPAHRVADLLCNRRADATDGDQVDAACGSDLVDSGKRVEASLADSATQAWHGVKDRGETGIQTTPRHVDLMPFQHIRRVS